jgi:uncharacterized protein with HEPN domain
VSREALLFLDDIIRSATKINNFTENLSFDSFCADECVFDAVLMNLLIIGEATKNLPPQITATMSEIDWSGAAGMRDIIAHHYFGIDAVLVWDIIKHHVPIIHEAAIVLCERLEARQNN